MSSRADSYVYNAKTGKWEPKSSGSNSTPTQNPTSNNSKPPEKNNPQNKATNTPSTTTKNNTVATTNSSSKVDSKSEADKKYIEIEFNTLEGDIPLVPTHKTVRIKAGDTIKLEGVGNYLSGLYYVSAVKSTIDKDSGYSITLSVIKTGFGDSLKYSSGTSYNNPTSKPGSTKSNTETVDKKVPNLSVGDKVMFISVDGEYTYANSSEGKRVPNWVKKKVHTVDSVSTDGNRVRLKEIVSWTYSKYLKKV